MKVKDIGKSDPLYCSKDKVYDMGGESFGMWQVVEESGEDSLYSPEVFEIVEEKGDAGNADRA